MHRFLDYEATCFDQVPSDLGAGLMPEGNRLRLGVDRRANVFATPLGAETPNFVQHFDGSAGVDFAHEMQPPSRQGHPPGWDQDAQGSAQPPYRRTTACLSRSLVRQCRRIILVHIPAPEERCLRLNLVESGELVPRPKAAAPQTVEAFDLVVALGFVVRREERFDPTEQTQSHDLTQHVRMGVPTAEGAFVVELMQAGQPDRRPAVQQMVAACATGLVPVLRQADGVREVIDGMKVLDFLATAHILGNDIGGEDGIHVPSEWPGIVGRTRARAEWVGQVVLCENALNSRFAGQGRDVQLLEACPDRMCANQAVARLGRGSLFEHLAHCDHRLHHRGGHLLGRAVRRTRAVGKVGRRIAPIFGPPFVEPCGRTVQVAANVAAVFALQAPPDRFAAQVLFGGSHDHRASLMET